MSLPRGIRNNNPGNIDRGSPWQGLAKDQSGDPRFAIFESPVWGIRALARVLITYQDKHGLRTIRGIVHRWAPPVENDSEAYVQQVVRSTGFGAEQQLDLHSYEHMEPLVKAIIQHENGQQPYDKGTIDKGLELAGVKPELKPLAKSKTISGAAAATAGVVLTGVAEVLQETASSVEPLVAYSDSLKWVFLAVTLAGIGLVAWARIKDRVAGVH